MTDLTLAAYTAGALIVTKVVERIRAAAPAWLFDSWRGNLLAIAVGLLLTYGGGTAALPPLTGYAWWVDRLLIGVGLGAGAGWLADLAGRSGPRAGRLLPTSLDHTTIPNV